jgi:hypothetical protein
MAMVAALTGVLAGCGRGVVHRDHLGHITVHHGRGPGAHLFGDGEDEVAAHRQPYVLLHHGVGRGQHGGHARFVVEVA